MENLRVTEERKDSSQQKKRVFDVEGFKVEVWVEDLLPHVRVGLRDGRVLIETNKVSLVGLERLSEVFKLAAPIASQEMEVAYRRAALEVERAASAEVPVPRVSLTE